MRQWCGITIKKGAFNLRPSESDHRGISIMGETSMEKRAEFNSEEEGSGRVREK